MPYAGKICGIYKIVNLTKNDCYVGQSQNVKKRVTEHFRLLRRNMHTNARLQNSYNKYGEQNFKWEIEVICENPNDLDSIENAFISGDAKFVEPVFYNIADFAKAPMRGNRHSDATRQRISAGRRATTFNYRSDEYRSKMSKIHRERILSNPNYVDKLRFILNNPEMSYAERGRVVGIDTSTTRKMALKYAYLEGEL